MYQIEIYNFFLSVHNIQYFVYIFLNCLKFAIKKIALIVLKNADW